MNILHTCIDGSIHDIVKENHAHHLGVFEAAPAVLQAVEQLWNAYPTPHPAFQQYPLLKTIFDMLQRPGKRVFIFSTRSGETLAAVRTDILHGEHVWFRWLEAPELQDAVTKQCLDKNIYGHAITVWSYC